MKKYQIQVGLFAFMAINSAFASSSLYAKDCILTDWLTCSSSDSCCEDCIPADSCVDDYCGCCESTSILKRLEESGITFKADFYQMYQGVAAGGVRQEFDYGGHGDYIATLDMDKLAGKEGLYLKIGAEHRFGMFGGPPDGSVLPSALPTALPADTNDLILTNVLFTQFLSEEFAVSFGKLDTLDGDANAFAHARGTKQFSNTAFIFNPITLRTIPYSTLGVSFSYLKDLKPIYTFSVLNAVDTATTDGFGQLFDQGAVLTSELRLPTNFMNKPGHQLFGATWSSREFASLGGDPRLAITPVGIPQQSGSWSTYWNFDQYLVYDKGCCTEEARGWGVFGRAAIGDDATNPLSYFLSFGVGGDSMIHGREKDYFGIGWYQLGTSDELNPITSAALNLGLQGQGIELYYRIQATDHVQITPDIQITDPARNGIDTAYLFGVRALMSF
ncbi:Carbohydrate-selective porin, OprB family [Rubinisphaera italica]|uniref:Carbohydrate-selective porin, OprB family n=2 Tax=Rubinisphaera italica TaxID=2527969 RepID=A0A5C5XE33_9PLAN|nr:Carbohydrate-selective porin, OprB family [Rubinisphaera italica]